MVSDTEEDLSFAADGAQFQTLGSYQAAVYMAFPQTEETFHFEIGTESFENTGVFFAMMPVTMSQMDDIAEIRELMALKVAADEYVESSSSSKPKKPEPVEEPEDDYEDDETEDVASEPEEDTEAEVVVEGTDVYKEYIGKRVLHKSVGYGVVRTCDGKYLGIEFEEGLKAGKITNYSLEACLSKGLIQIV